MSDAFGSQVANVKGLLLAAVVLLLSGCAATRPVTLSYPPADEGDVVPEPAAEQDASSATSLVLEVFDARTEKSRLAVAGGWLNPDAVKYVAKNDVQAWVRDAFESELPKAGVSVTTQQALDGDALLPHLTVDIQRLDCNLGWAYDADVWLQVTLEHPGEAPLVRRYQGRGSAGLNLAATTSAVGESLALALQDAIRQMRAEVDMARRL
jgi:uncharacterized lipoprotein YajG